MTTLIRLTSIPWMPHFVLTLLLAAVFAAAAAFLDRRGGRNRLYLAVWVFLTWTSAVIAGSWLMFAVHG